MENLVNHLEGRLLFAIPKKGRLNPPVLNLLQGADIQFRQEHRQDIALVKNHHIALVFLPAADIPYVVDEGNVDIGITGKDQVLEYEAEKASELRQHALSEEEKVQEVLDLGFGGCKLQVQVPESSTNVTSANDLVGKKIATSFKALTEQYFRRLESHAPQQPEANPSSTTPATKVRLLNGSVETACKISGVDGIVDLVESGETMRAAGLKAIDTVVSSTAVLIRSKHPRNQKVVDMISSRIEGVIDAQSYLLTIYNIPRRLLPHATRVTPGKRAPTITSLDGGMRPSPSTSRPSTAIANRAFSSSSASNPSSRNTSNAGNPVKPREEEEQQNKEKLEGEPGAEDQDWVAVSSMVKKKEVADVMDNLKELGATDILCLRIENSRAAA